MYIYIYICPQVSAYSLAGQNADHIKRLVAASNSVVSLFQAADGAWHNPDIPYLEQQISLASDLVTFHEQFKRMISSGDSNTERIKTDRQDAMFDGIGKAVLRISIGAQKVKDFETTARVFQEKPRIDSQLPQEDSQAQVEEDSQARVVGELSLADRLFEFSVVGLADSAMSNTDLLDICSLRCVLNKTELKNKLDAAEDQTNGYAQHEGESHWWTQIGDEDAEYAHVSLVASTTVATIDGGDLKEALKVLLKAGDGS